ncbi:hypothetical protein BC940DRAFT_337198 [Gongronella butleri]|nr:hypothetical protein BC940DRAFT_337198 [Gongronella butleri]
MAVDTSYDENEVYSQTFCGVFAFIIALLMVRHAVLVKSHHGARFGGGVLAQWRRVDRWITNACSRELAPTFLPPFGALLVAVAVLTVLVPVLFVANDYSEESSRAGFITIAMVPFLLCATGKYSALHLLTGMSARRLNWMHRFLGWCMVCTATLHMAPIFYQITKKGHVASALATSTKVQTGFIAYLSLLVVFVGSLPIVRNRQFEVFLATHVAALIFLGTIAKHSPYAMRYFAVGLICYSMNVLATWFVQSRVARARLRATGTAATCTRLTLLTPIRHHPGQHVYLCIPQLSWFQWHPFTITSTSFDVGNTEIEVMAMVRGNFTKRLNALAGEFDQLTIHAFMVGPCGREWATTLPQTMLHQHDRIVLAMGGAGVTFGMRLLRQLIDYMQCVAMDPTEESRLLRTHSFHFVWSVRRPQDFACFATELAAHRAAFAQARTTYPHLPTMHLALHYTGPQEELAALEATEMGQTLPFTPLPTFGHQENRDSYHTIDEKSSNEGAAPSEKSCDTTTSSTGVSHATDGLRPICARVDPMRYLAHVPLGDTIGLFACGPPTFNSVFKNAVARLPLKQSMSHLAKAMNASLSDAMPLGTMRWSTAADAVWQTTWVADGEPGYIGACIGLFLFAIATRGIVAVDMYCLAWHARRYAIVLPTTSSASGCLIDDFKREEAGFEFAPAWDAPQIISFSWGYDPFHGLLAALEALCNFLLMLVVVTGNGAYLLVVVIGILWFKQQGAMITLDHHIQLA